MTTIRQLVSGMFSVALLSAGAVSGQTYPDKPIRIVTGDTGGSTDFVARLIAQETSGALGQPLIVENRGGAGTIPGEIVMKTAPDGYTLLVVGGSFIIEPLLRDTVPYDPFRDFAPITLIGGAANVLTVHPLLPANSVKELIAYAKTRPGVLNYAGGTTGTLTHLSGELFKSMAEVNIVRVPYKGIAPGVNALLANEVQLMFANPRQVLPHVKLGKLRALAVTSAEPSTVAPGLPTMAATLPGYEAVTILGMFAPAKTPEPIIKRLNQEIVRVLNQPAVKQKLLDSGEQAVGSSPEELTAKMKSQTVRMGKVIKDAGIRAD